ncbi:MAG TPA: hypothetical protein VMT61_03655 [Candidatus Binataceae bacterium]|nr:hypothetical protein [Candidatus Binataceae bacterium]
MYKVNQSPVPSGVFGSSRRAHQKPSHPTTEQPALYKAWSSREHSDLICDRCASDSVPITRVLVDRSAEEVHLFCGSCYDKMWMTRLTRREWRTLENTETERWNRASLTSALAKAGLLRP